MALIWNARAQKRVDLIFQESGRPDSRAEKKGAACRPAQRPGLTGCATLPASRPSGCHDCWLSVRLSAPASSAVRPRQHLRGRGRRGKRTRPSHQPPRPQAAASSRPRQFVPSSPPHPTTATFRPPPPPLHGGCRQCGPCVDILRYSASPPWVPHRPITSAVMPPHL